MINESCVSEDDIPTSEKVRRAQMLIEVLNIQRDRNVPGRFVTSYGTKTPRELYLTVKRIIDFGE
jgi:hypothetical protein